MPIRDSPFALRITQRTSGCVGIIYRRRSDTEGRDRLQRIAMLGPLAFTVATSLLRDGVRLSGTRNGKNVASKDLAIGPYHPLAADSGARIAVFALLASGLRDAERLNRALGHLRHANSDEAAWWLGLLSSENNVRPLRALRILTEAVE